MILQAKYRAAVEKYENIDSGLLKISKLLDDPQEKVIDDRGIFKPITDTLARMKSFVDNAYDGKFCDLAQFYEDLGFINNISTNTIYLANEICCRVKFRNSVFTNDVYRYRNTIFVSDVCTPTPLSATRVQWWLPRPLKTNRPYF